MKVSKNNINELINAAKAAFTCYIVSAKTINKDNQELTAISFRKQGESIAPTLYAESILEAASSIMGAIGIIANTLDAAEANMPVVPKIDKAYVLGHASFILLNTAKNKGIVDTCLNWAWNDLSLVANFILDIDNESVQTAKVTKQLAEQLHITPEEFYEAASVNAIKDANIKPLRQVLAEITGMPEEAFEAGIGIGPEMWVITNTSRTNGAAIATSVQVMTTLAEEVDDDLLIIPSSRHEVIVIPSNAGMRAIEMAKMISEVNSEHVSTANYLSDNPYIFRKETKTFGFYEDTEGETI